MDWFKNLSLLGKIIICLVATMAVGQIMSLTIFVRDFEKNALEEMYYKAKAIGQMAENARNAAGEASQRYNAIKTEELLKEAGEKLKGLTVGSDSFFSTLRQTAYYNTAIPVVWAFKAALKGAEESHFKFKPTRFNPRNPGYAPVSEVEKSLLQELQQSSGIEVSRIDEKIDVFRYMRAVQLSKDCLVCHGGRNDDPTRPDTDTDPVGFKKDGKKTGDKHGAFQIIMDLGPMHDKVDGVRNKSILAGIVVLLVSSFLVVLIIRSSVIAPVKDLAGQMDEGADQVATASNQVSQSAQNLAEGANNQASALEETSSSLEEMAGMAKKSAKGASSADDLAQQCRKGAEEGMLAMDQTIKAMGEINESTGQMGNIIKTIEEIAFQTNLLALNAAVEAARAGEAGKGFAVVAEEVRNLAQRSAAAAKDTANLIAESVSKAEDGTKIAENAGASLKKVVDEIQKVADHLNEISGASVEQSEGVSQVSRAVSAMDQVTQQNAATAEESAAASEELSAQADQLKSMVNTLMVLIAGGDSASSASTQKAPGRKLLQAPRPAAPRPQFKKAATLGKQAGAAKKPGGGQTEVNPDEVIPFGDDDFKDF